MKNYESIVENVGDYLAGAYGKLEGVKNEGKRLGLILT